MDLREQGSGTRHPWELARVGSLGKVVRLLDLAPDARILDLGCGDGFALNQLFPQGGVGVDAHFTDAQVEHLSTLYPSCSWVRDLDQAQGPFDLVLALDVLEHVADDRGLVAQLSARLKPGGLLLVTVPAFQALFTAHDRFLEHQRRYSRSGLTQVLRSAELQVERSGYLFSSLLAPRAVQRVVERVREPRSVDGIGAWSHGPALTRAVELVLRADNRVLLELELRGVRLPGLSTWALCRKS